MRYTAPLCIGALLLVSTVTAGCVAAGAAAGGAAGASLASNEDREDLDYWLKTNDTTTRIGQAMKEERLVTGMSPTQVKLVMGAKGRFDSLPTTRDTSGAEMVWDYRPNLSRLEGYRITFDKNRKVSRVERTEPECEQQMTGRRSSDPCP